MALALLRSTVFFCISVFWATLLSANQVVTLEVEAHETTRDQQGKLRHVVTVGQPFTIHVKVAGQAQGQLDFKAPAHSSLQHFGTQTSFSSFNGAVSSTLTHSYQAVVDKEGEVVFGPIKVSINGATHESEIIKVQAVKGASAHSEHSRGASSSASKRERDIFCRLTSNAKNVVIGQTVTVTLTIYLRGDIQQIGLEPYHFNGFLTKELPESQRRREMVDGTPFVVLEKQFLLNPTEEGVKKIAPFTVAYDRLVQDESAAHNFFGMVMFGGAHSERGKVSSSSLEITVTKLPSYKGAINGVGNFSQFTASVDKHEAVVNEPISLRLSAKGNAHFDQVTFDHPELPAFCKFYSSKSATSYDDQNQLNGTKNFEFIVQVGQAGTVELPAQKFTFFDAQRHHYTTLTSKPITLTIKPSPDGQVVSLPVQQESQEKQQPPEEKKEESSIKDIHFIYEDFGQEQPLPALPWWLFTTIILLSLVIWGARLTVPTKYSARLAALFSCQNHQKKILHHKKNIEAAVQKGDAHALHSLFVALVCAQIDIDPETFSEADVVQVLLDNGWVQEKIVEFLEFLNKCASIRFGQGTQHKKVWDEVLDQATYWLLFLVK